MLPPFDTIKCDILTLTHDQPLAIHTLWHLLRVTMCLWACPKCKKKNKTLILNHDHHQLCSFDETKYKDNIIIINIAIITTLIFNSIITIISVHCQWYTSQQLLLLANLQSGFSFLLLIFCTSFHYLLCDYLAHSIPSCGFQSSAYFPVFSCVFY